MNNFKIGCICIITIPILIFWLITKQTELCLNLLGLSLILFIIFYFIAEDRCCID